MQRKTFTDESDWEQDFSTSSTSSDDSYVLTKKQKNEGSKTPARYDGRSSRHQSRDGKQQRSQTISVNIEKDIWKNVSLNEINKSPQGEECRFVPFEEIKDIIIFPEKYLKKDEKGINTILDDYNPLSPDKLSFFGLNDETITTKLNEVVEMTDSELEEQLNWVMQEISKYDSLKVDTTCTVTPAFDHNIKRSISIKQDVNTFNWKEFGSKVHFDVITMDPPWNLSQSSVTRGVSLSYDQIDADTIGKIPVPYIQTDGYIFLWVIACHVSKGTELLKNWGYTLVCPLNWVKTSRYGRYLPSHGYYLQHNKETCLVARKGKDPDGMNYEKFTDLIIEQRSLRQSHKPIQIYEIIESVFPDCLYLEVFARSHNLREGWVSIGIELPE